MRHRLSIVLAAALVLVVLLGLLSSHSLNYSDNDEKETNAISAIASRRTKHRRRKRNQKKRHQGGNYGSSKNSQQQYYNHASNMSPSSSPKKKKPPMRSYVEKQPYPNNKHSQHQESNMYPGSSPKKNPEQPKKMYEEKHHSSSSPQKQEQPMQPYEVKSTPMYPEHESSSSDESSTPQSSSPEKTQQPMKTVKEKVKPAIEAESKAIKLEGMENEESKSPEDESMMMSTTKEENNEMEGGGLKAQVVGEEGQGAPESAKEQAAPEPDECGRTDTFTAYVLVEHALMDVEMIDDQTLSILGASFRDTYNKLNTPNMLNDVCDAEHLRVVDDVEVSVSDTIYKKMEGDMYNVRNFIYKITGRGFAITDDTHLFELGDVTAENFGSMILSFSDFLPKSSGCKCFFNYDEARAPTTKEFKQAFDHAIGGLRELRNARSVNKVIEYDAVECHKWENEFFSEVDVEFAEEPSQEDYESLGVCFHNSYNTLILNFCDPSFRGIEEVRVEEIQDDERRRYLDEGALTDKKKKRRKKLRFKVKGRCKGCRRKTKLFNEDGKDNVDDGGMSGRGGGGDRTLGHLKDNYDFHHVFQGKDVCFCSSQPKGVRAPSESEFLKRYSATLAHTKGTKDYQVEGLAEHGWVWKWLRGNQQH